MFLSDYMKDFIFRNYLKFGTFFYERIFHQKMSNEVQKFFKSLSYMGAGTIIAALFSFTFNILAARFLGPEGYGEFTLIQSVAMFLYIPMLLGFNTALIKYSSEDDDFVRQSRIISTCYILVVIFIIISIFFYYIFSSKISDIFSISVGFFNLSVIFAVLYVFYTLTTNTLRGLHEFKKYVRFQLISNIILLSTLLLFFYVNFLSTKSMFYSFYISYGLTGGFILILLSKYLNFNFDRSWANKLTNYSSYAFLGGLSSIFYSNIDKIFINKYMTIRDVGIYKAYNYAFLTLLVLLIGIFITVLFPVASRSGNNQVIFKRFNRLVPYIIILGLPITIGSGYIILYLYGGQYPFDLKLALLFGISGICVCIDTVYGWLMNAVGNKGIKITAFAAVILALSNIFLNMYLIPLIGIEGAIIATIVSYILNIGIILSKRNYFESEVAGC